MIGLVGLNHKNAPIQIREQFSFTEADNDAFLNQLTQKTGIESGFVLATCNRTEVYFHAEEINFNYALQSVIEAVCDYTKVVSDCSEYFYQLTNEDAANHLFRVAAGLDSLILGEDQIIGQIRNTYQRLKSQNKLDKFIIRLFDKALEAGKKVRCHTKINTGASSISAAAVETALNHYPDLHNQNILMIGAGETGSLAVQSLEKHGFKSLYIANRTREKAKILAKKYNGQTITLEDFPEKLKDINIVIIATGAQQPVITTEMMENHIQSGDLYPRLLIDLSVPRNICEKIGSLPGIDLYAIDDLKKTINRTAKIRQSAVIQAEKIIEELTKEFEDWHNSQKLSATIIKIKENMTEVGRKKAEEFQNQTSESANMPEFSDYLANRYISHFIKNLKKATDNGRREEFIDFANELFDMKK